MIPYLDLKAQYRALKPELDAAVLKTLESCEFILGSEVAAFEQEFATAHSAAHGIGVNSGTSALHLALLAAGVGAGDEVITVPYTFVATTAAIRYCNATPVFVDIDPETFMIDVSQIEGKITPRTKAILPVHLYGQSCDMDPILEIAKRHNLAVIEDAAQAHLAEYKGRRVGALGDAGIFSFYPGKNLGAAGEGGLITTNDSALDRKLRLLRNWGMEQQYHHTLKAFNYRMEGMQGAILRVKLRHLDQWTDARRGLAATYGELLKGAVQTPVELPNRKHVYHVYAILSPRRDALAEHLRSKQIQFGIHYPVPIHLQEAHADLGYKREDFPVAEKVCDQVLSLPIFPEMTQEQIATVATAVREVH